MSDHRYVITGETTGDRYLVLIDPGSLCIFHPRSWGESKLTGIWWHPLSGRQIKGRWLWLRARRAQRYVNAAEKRHRRALRNDRRAARLVERKGR